jgi:hypothetical protein
VINSFSTEENRDQYSLEHPALGLSEDFVPEPILSYLSMREALYYGIDRYQEAVEVAKTYLPACTLFTPSYFIDAEAGLSIRGTEIGQKIVEDFGGDSYGYQGEEAISLFKDAVAAAISDGYYTAGTANEYLVIELLFTYASSGNATVQAYVENIKEQYEALLVDDEHFVRIDFVLNDVAFPSNYEDYMIIANTDLGLGGIANIYGIIPLDYYRDETEVDSH